MKSLRQLAIELERHVRRVVNPKRHLEQYRTPANLAAHMVYYMSNVKCGIVVDLGCGTGMLTYAASLLLSLYAVGVDIDSEQLVEGMKSKLYSELIVDFVQADVNYMPLRISQGYCVVQNPPFGVWKRGADIEFLRAALTLRPLKIVSLHKYSDKSLRLISDLLRSNGYSVEGVVEDEIIIPAMYETHRRRVYRVKVAVVIAARGG